MTIFSDLQRIRDIKPLIFNITNYVVMNNTANALLAIGASPVMACAIEEMEELAGISSALVINIGTLSTPWIDAMLIAGRAANRLHIPVVLDPCGSGASRFRTETAQMLIREVHPTIIRGNASEIRSLIQLETNVKGVDSNHTPDQVIDDARALSLLSGCVVSVSGEVDLIVSDACVARIANGHKMMASVTGMGCTASAITGAFAAINANSFEAATSAMSVMGVAGELAALHSTGPGNFQMHFLDVLYGMLESDFKQRINLTI